MAVIWPHITGHEHVSTVRESAVQNFQRGDFIFDVLFNDAVIRQTIWLYINYQLDALIIIYS